MTSLLLALTLLGFQAPPAARDRQSARAGPGDRRRSGRRFRTIRYGFRRQATRLSCPRAPTHKADGKGILIGLKDFKAEPLPNKSGYPLAFPRPGSKKLFENARVIIWDYTWTTGVATPMHFHDKDVVVFYLEDGDLQSTTPKGEKTVNPYKPVYDSLQPARPDPHGNS